jgi:hypothetical protein
LEGVYTLKGYGELLFYAMLIAASLIIIHPTVPTFESHYFSSQYNFHILNKSRIFIEALANNLILVFGVDV